ncbi:Afadin [Halotydeus destructor]|nr:Afadin [Halotydeus destructor]
MDLFELTTPNEDLEFHGVMRFYFQDEGQKVATKCVRVSSTATTQDVINILIEKFRADIRMLSIPEYALYETHENGEERKLSGEEKPLLVQLNWHKDDREGRFLLRRMDDKTCLPGFHKSTSESSEGFNFKRKLSKREKKEKKKMDKEKLKSGKDSIAEKLYTEIPESRFTRSISNPEAVLRRRRHQLLEKKLQELVKVGGIKAGGTLRIFGETLDKDVAYKTLLLSTENTAAYVVEEILEKYNRDRSESPHFCLVQLIVPHNITDINLVHDLNGGSGIREYILDDDDCPLAIEKNHLPTRGALSFHIKRRPADYVPRKRKKKPSQIQSEQQHDSSLTNLDNEDTLVGEDIQQYQIDSNQPAGVNQRQSPVSQVVSPQKRINGGMGSSVSTGDTMSHDATLNNYNNENIYLGDKPQQYHSYVSQSSSTLQLQQQHQGQGQDMMQHINYHKRPNGSIASVQGLLPDPVSVNNMNQHDQQANNNVPPGDKLQHYHADMRRSTSSLQQHPKGPEIQVIHLQKSNNGMGLSIVATKGLGQDKLGIYIKTVVKGGAADADGRLQAGDQLLTVNGHSLIDITQEMAAQVMTQTGPVVTLEVAKQAAAYNGLDALLGGPAAAANARAAPQRPRSMHLPDAVRALPAEADGMEIRRPQPPTPVFHQYYQQQQQMHSQHQLPLHMSQPPGHMYQSHPNLPMHPPQHSPGQMVHQRYNSYVRPPYPGTGIPQQWRPDSYPNPPGGGYQSRTIGPIRMTPTPAQRSTPQIQVQLQQAEPVPQVSYRYGPSGYPPKPGEVPRPSQSSLPSGSLSTNALYPTNGAVRPNDRGTVAASPWEREEKEKRLKQREMEMRRMKEEAIRHLEILPQRTPKQDELLRKLLFDLEFRRRAEEENDDDMDDFGRHQNGHRTLPAGMPSQQNWDNGHPQGPVPRPVQPQIRPNVDEWTKRNQHNYANVSSLIEEQEERLKRLRFEEIKRQQELQNAQHAEEQLLRVVKSRQVQEEEVLTVRETRTIAYPAKLDLIANTHEADVPPPLPKSPPPFDGANSQPKNDRLVNGDSSGSEGAAATITKFPSALRNSESNGAPVQKKVSWNDNPDSEPSSPRSENGGVFTLQDIDEVLGTPTEPEEAMNFAVTNTPNVIGAQEVYRDPRERIKQEKLKNQQVKPLVTGPEKLSFKEKMKMFAMEAGENALDGNSKDKLKHSKAQREIDGETKREEDDRQSPVNQEQQHQQMQSAATTVAATTSYE